MLVYKYRIPLGEFLVRPEIVLNDKTEDIVCFQSNIMRKLDPLIETGKGFKLIQWHELDENDKRKNMIRNNIICILENFSGVNRIEEELTEINGEIGFVYKIFGHMF